MDGLSGRREAWMKRWALHGTGTGTIFLAVGEAREGTRGSRVTRKGVTGTVGTQTLRGRGQSSPPTWPGTASCTGSRAPSEVLFPPPHPPRPRGSPPSPPPPAALFLLVQLGALIPHQTACWMSGSDGEPSLRKSTTSRNAAISPLASLSLTSDHITDALAKSPDGGATLDLAYKGLTDVGESGADELSRVGEDELIGTRSSVVR